MLKFNVVKQMPTADLSTVLISIAGVIMSNARNKLNAAAIHGVLIVAGVVSFIAQSWPVFWLVVAVLLGTAILAGDIRPGNRHRKR